ncbi:MAG TPA: Gfo/Idh/MocA family oxidoreductase, partial [Pirellulales bacterium]
MSASSKVRWGVLSTAAIATKVSKAMHGAENAEPVAVASRNLAKAQAWGKEHNVATAYGSYEELLDSDVDAVYIGLPPALHHEWTIKAAEKGKHVLCEKPLAMNLAEAQEMAAACEQHKVMFMDGVMWVHHARAADMHTHITGAELGELRRMTSAFSFNWDEVPENNIRVK